MNTELNTDSNTAFKNLIDRLDQRAEDLFDLIRGHPVADRIFYTASQVGDHALVWQLLVAMKALSGKPKQTQNFWRVTSALAFESLLVNGILKSIFPRERPVNDEPRPHYLRTPLTASFPSGHASAATLATILLKTGKRSSPVVWALASVVAVSRVYVKIHHASDVIAGAAVGYVLGKAIKTLWPIK